jgi:hypothetical protein
MASRAEEIQTCDCELNEAEFAELVEFFAVLAKWDDEDRAGRTVSNQDQLVNMASGH